MRVRVVRTPGELHDTIGHKVMVRKDWEGTVQRSLDIDEISDAGFHPQVNSVVYLVRFDEWEQDIAVSAINLVVIDSASESS